ncbi:hypothetical protein [Microbacterium sp. 77mftsu3.1]|uniref:hypothetical protein n=1 Tax=Microbacterium sp. 77mftsu3.1 TaxID=1761802 RepID=UPI00035D1AC1|nr:hypothetical protein [Microbacterium sp. 77mftsu3.1]SDH47851.1 hypothetical protein SAMN04488590_3395 [Microbacterium sp. 77mftsu3.1]
MDFISPGPAGTVADAVAIAGIALFVAAYALAAKWEKHRAAALTGIAGLLVVIFAVTLAIVTVFGQRDDVAARVGKHYGIALTTDHVNDLRYPVSEPDKGEPASYGTTTIDIDGRPTQVMLVWDGEHLILNGPGTELERR